jgi:Protein of unknown function (DUF1588)/Protein of unknown function (DUF1592)/Protein of unknown function (DUF1595)/Protein of unknown function (DUF1585)/Protein of unknown function (DUF1587)
MNTSNRMTTPALALLLFAGPTVACTGGIASNRDGAGADDGNSALGGNNNNGSGGLQPDPEFVPPPEAVKTPFVIKGGLQRLSSRQFQNTIADLFGAKFATNANIELDFRGEGFAAFSSVGGREIAVSANGVRKYEDSAIKLATAILADAAQRTAWIPCKPSGNADATCMGQFVAKVGRRLFRRPLTDTEKTRYTSIGTKAGQTLSDFNAGARYALTGLLLSPKTTYHTELGEDAPDGRRLTAFEKGSRLAYLVWGTTPDEEMLTDAENGTLNDAPGLATAADRLLANKARTAEGLRGFVEGYAALYLLPDAPKDTVKYPAAGPEGKAAMTEAVQRLVAEIVVQEERPFADVFDSGYVFANNKNAGILGVQAAGVDFAKSTLPQSGLRIGFLTEPAILATTARQAETSPTLRGKFVNDLLCIETPAPPVGVDTKLEPRKTGTTKRQQIEGHMAKPTCAGCHSAMDPIGFGLENFDAVGAIQLKDNGVTVDASGSLTDVAFDGPRELSALVAGHEALAACLVQRVYGHALGHAPSDEEGWVLSALKERFEKVGGRRLTTLMRDIVLSPAFSQAPAL